MATGTASDFATALLAYASAGKIKGLAAGNYNTASNQSFIERWVQREGTKALNNPLATTQRVGGSYPLPGNKSGVQQYVWQSEGVQATGQTLGNGRYGDILAAIATGNATAVDNAGGVSHGLLTWSGGGYATLRNVTANPAYKIPTQTLAPLTAGNIAKDVTAPIVSTLSAPVDAFTAWVGGWFPRAAKIGLGIILLLVAVAVLIGTEKTMEALKSTAPEMAA